MLGLCQPAAGDQRQVLFGSPQGGESFSAFPGDQGLKAEPDQRSFFLNTGQLCGSAQQFVFYVQGGAHESPLQYVFPYANICIYNAFVKGLLALQPLLNLLGPVSIQFFQPAYLPLLEDQFQVYYFIQAPQYWGQVTKKYLTNQIYLFLGYLLG